MELNIQIPCLSCGVKNSLHLSSDEDMKLFMHLCPSCGTGTAFVEGSIYTFRREFLDNMIKRGHLSIGGKLVATDMKDRFSSISLVGDAGTNIQKGCKITEEYLESLTSALEKARSHTDVLKVIENIDQEESP
jgi:hypothetical protein